MLPGPGCRRPVVEECCVCVVGVRSETRNSVIGNPGVFDLGLHGKGLAWAAWKSEENQWKTIKTKEKREVEKEIRAPWGALRRDPGLP